MQSFFEENILDTEYIQGYYLHLITDYLFYKAYLDSDNGKLYSDYNKLNKFLIEKYGIKIPTEVQDEVEFEDGKTEIIDQDSICKFIEAVAEVSFLDKSKLIEFINSFNIKNNERDENMNDTIEMKIANAAANHWQSDEPKTMEEAIQRTDRSEIASVIGLVQKLGLDDEIIQQLIGNLNEEGKPIGDGIIYTQGIIPQDIAIQIKDRLEGNEKYKNILNVLSIVHDNWVKNNPDNFFKPGRNRERQFVTLELLDWAEVQNDLVFLKPILEATGIEIDLEKLKKEFDMMQEKYMVDNKIFSNEDLVNYLMKGSDSYEVLKGLDTDHGGEIDFLLKQRDVAEQMAEQMEKRGVIAGTNQLRQVTTNEIAHSSMRMEVTTPEVKGVRAFFENLRNKLQNLFKGKEEK